MQISQNESEPSGCDLPFVLNCFELAEIFLSKSELHKKTAFAKRVSLLRRPFAAYAAALYR